MKVDVPDIGQPGYTVHVDADIFKEVDGEMTEYEKGRIIFLGRREESLHSFQSFPVYLPEGLYQARIAVENEVYWASFTVLPRSIQRQNPATKKGLFITTDHPVLEQKPLICIPVIRNSITGESLNDDAAVRVLDNGDWTRLWQADNFYAGTTQTFKVSCSGYQTQVVEVNIDSNQSICVLKIDLLPSDVTIDEETGEVVFPGRYEEKEGGFFQRLKEKSEARKLERQQKREDGEEE
jgi:hypothetical protein